MKIHLLAAALAVFLPTAQKAQSAAIHMDGVFTDWTPGIASFTDNTTPATGIDLLDMQVSNDDQYLYIRLAVGSEVDLQDDLVPQTIRLYIDGDNNASTGTAVQTGYGAEVQVKFETRTVTEYFGPSSNVSWNTLDLVPLPTVTSDTFEIAISRNALPDGNNTLFTSSTIKLLFRETDGGDAMPNAGTTFSYTFDNTPVTPIIPITVPKAQAAQVRVTAWNVLADGITNATLQGNFQRMLTALSPDIIGFSECVTSTAAQVKTRLDAWMPNGGTGWYVVKDDFDMVIASRWPIIQTWPGLSRQFAALIDLPSTHATDLLFTAAHLNCCNADATRQNQCDEFVQFVQDAKSLGGSVTVPNNTPIVYAGDLNSVGSAQQLTTLSTGDIQNNANYGPDGPMDWDGTPFAHADCPQINARMAYSWRSNSSAYPSGLLDHIYFSDAAAALAKSFTLRTAVIPATTLSALGLLSDDASAASDHFPITADLNVPLVEINVTLRAMLEGPFDQQTGLMQDSLRVKGLIPLTEPYADLGYTQSNGVGGETTTSAVLNVSGNNAIVDWVRVELRTSGTPSVVYAARNCLIQRDGDVVDVDGASPVHFNLPANSYHVVLRHRTHLGVMTAATQALGPVPSTIDLTLSSTTTYGTDATKSFGGLQMLWTGNAQRDSTLRYTGATNDRDPILLRIGGTLPTATAAGYLQEDVNLDGLAKYTGTYNDRDPILINIGGTVPTNTRVEQLP
ncbi:MAG: endonuclease/exonuclease/phosphatase family protein [Flavobacteriales bacterium]|nr:endonuclease/exonuclease/phosphatase family protein [Flavobacteriales bacterium]